MKKLKKIASHVPVLKRKWYRGFVLKNEVFTRSWRMAFKCLWQWDVEPWFRKVDYIPYMGKNYYHYRWQRFYGKYKKAGKLTIAVDGRGKTIYEKDSSAILCE